MDTLDFGALGIGMFVSLFAALQLAWYVGVLVLLAKIWLKVRHLPG